MSACAWLFVAVVLLFITLTAGLGLYMRGMEQHVMIPKAPEQDPALRESLANYVINAERQGMVQQGQSQPWGDVPKPQLIDEWRKDAIPLPALSPDVPQCQATHISGLRCARAAAECNSYVPHASRWELGVIAWWSSRGSLYDWDGENGHFWKRPEARRTQQ